MVINRLNLHTMGFFALLFTAFLFSTFGIMVRELDKAFGQLTQIALRFLLAGVLLLIWMIVRKLSFKIPRQKILHSIIFVLIGPIAVIFFTYSIINIKASNTIFLFYIGSITISFILGILIFKEEVNKQRLISLKLVFLGLLLFIYPFNSEFISLGVIAGLCAGIFDGISNMLRKSLKEVPREILLFYNYGIGGLIVLLLAFLKQETMITNITISSIIILIVYAFALIILGYLLLFGFKHFDINVGTIVLATEIFFAMMLI